MEVFVFSYLAGYDSALQQIFLHFDYLMEEKKAVKNILESFVPLLFCETNNFVHVMRDFSRAARKQHIDVGANVRAVTSIVGIEENSNLLSKICYSSKHLPLSWLQAFAVYVQLVSYCIHSNLLFTCKITLSLCQIKDVCFFVENKF